VVEDASALAGLLKYGPPGLITVLGLLAFYLLRNEGMKSKPSGAMLAAISGFMVFALVLKPVVSYFTRPTEPPPLPAVPPPPVKMEATIHFHPDIDQRTIRVTPYLVASEDDRKPLPMVRRDDQGAVVLEFELPSPDATFQFEYAPATGAASSSHWVSYNLRPTRFSVSQTIPEPILVDAGATR
jgi:hypothetical protein